MMATHEERTIAHQLAGMVADALPEGWAVDTSEEFAEHRGAYIDGPEGARLFLALDWRKSDRVEVRGIYPRTSVYVDAFTVGVSRDRGPAVIAREITRRLLPGYLAELARVQQDGIERVQYRQERHALAEIIAGIVGGTVDAERDDDTNTSVRWFNDSKGYGHVRIGYRADTISEVEVRSSNPERVLAALRALFA